MTESRVICAITQGRRGVGKPNLPVTLSNPDSSEPVTKGRNIEIKTGDHGLLESRISRFTRYETVIWSWVKDGRTN